MARADEIGAWLCTLPPEADDDVFLCGPGIYRELKAVMIEGGGLGSGTILVDGIEVWLARSMHTDAGRRVSRSRIESGVHGLVVTEKR